MRHVGVNYSGGLYLVNIPTLGTDNPMTLQDEIILALSEKVTRLENKFESTQYRDPDCSECVFKQYGRCKGCGGFSIDVHDLAKRL